jgi:phenylacetate-CoA ligase
MFESGRSGIESMDFRNEKNLHRQAFLNKLPTFIKRMSWNRAQINDFQVDALRNTLWAAANQSLWYKNRLSHIDIANFTPEMLPSIPIMTKKDLMENWEQIVAPNTISKADIRRHLESGENSGYFQGNLKALSSGGTSGTLGYYLYDWEAWSDHWAGINRSYIDYVASKSDDPSKMRFATISADCSIHISYALFDTFSNPLSATRHIPISLSIQTIVDQLNEFDPEYLHLYPSVLPILIHKAEIGELKISPHVILSTSEALKPSVKADAQKMWNSLVLDTWSSSEGSGSFPCLGGEGFHISEDLNIIEPLNVDEKGWSHGIAITNLYNRALPLIRYYIDDEFKFADEPCSCGNSFSKVVRVRGRVDEYLDYGGGLLVHPFAIESALSLYEQLLSFQVVQVSGGVCIKAVTSNSERLEGAEDRVKRALIGAGLTMPVVSIDYVDSLERSRGGKLRRVVRMESA